MRIILNCENSFLAVKLRDKIIKSLNGDIEGVQIDTWTYVKSGDNFDVIYHNPEQFVNDPLKNVLFRLEIDGSFVTFSTAWWKRNQEPSREMMCLHTGRIVEMLLRYFKEDYIKFTISE